MLCDDDGLACVGFECEVGECVAVVLCDDLFFCIFDSCMEAGCSSELLADYCLVDGVCYLASEGVVINLCLICEFASASDAFVVAPDGTFCFLDLCGPGVAICQEG